MIESTASDGTIMLMNTIAFLPRSIGQMTELQGGGSTLNLLEARQLKQYKWEEN